MGAGDSVICPGDLLRTGLEFDIPNGAQPRGRSDAGVVVQVGDLQVAGEDRAEKVDHADLDTPSEVGLVVGPGGELLPENDGVRVVCVGVHLYGFAALEGTGRDQALVGSEDGEKVSALACLACLLYTTEAADE